MELTLNTIAQTVIEDSIWEMLPKYISLLFKGWILGEYYLICCGILILSYFIFRNYKYYLISTLIIYAGLFIFYFFSIHYYYQDIEDWVNEGHSNALEYDEIFFSGLDTSVFFILYNLIFIIILFVHKRKS